MDYYATAPKSNSAPYMRTEPIDNTEWSPGLDPDDLRELHEAEKDPSKIIVGLPSSAVRMGYFSSLCLLFNRMIGTGIFNSASVIFVNTQSIGLSLVMWLLAAIISLAGVIVYIELGLSIPRWPFGPNGEKKATPRSGEAVNYFNYYLKRPLFLATCLYGITFITLENTAANSVSFAQNVLDSCHADANPGRIIAIALASNGVACLLHALSRKWGIIINNFFGVVKFLILVFIVIVGLIWINHDVAKDNFNTSTSFNFQNSPKWPFRYAEAFLNALFPYGLFHQLNYVISEIDQPKKIFPRASFYGVLTVAILYTAVNITWAAIIPKAQLFATGGIDVGFVFMQLTLGKVMTSKYQLQTFWTALKSISAGGNLIVVAFTVARVKQEIAKEGILPYSLFFAKSSDLSLGRLLGRKPPKADPNTFTSENTPAAALALHWVLTAIIVVATVLAFQPQPYSSTPAYTFLYILFAYIIYVTVFIFISSGLLYLRFSPRAHWAEKSEFKHPILSVTAALILFVGVLFPFIIMWVPDPDYKSLARSSGLVPWYASQSFGLGVIACGFLYWVGLRCYISIRSSREGKTLYVKREPKFVVESSGDVTQIAEIVTLKWVRDVGMSLDEIEEVHDRGRHRDPRASPGSEPAHHRSWASGATFHGRPAGPQELYSPESVAGLQRSLGSQDGLRDVYGQHVIYEEERQQYRRVGELP